MPMKLSIGLSRKVGQPHYGSLGASCAVELELDGSALHRDPAEFHRRVRAVYAACDRAIRDELERQQAGAPDESASGRSGPDTGLDPPRRPATAAQVRSLEKLAARGGFGLDAVVAGRFGVDAAEGLTVAEASRLIDELRRAPAGATA